MAPLAAALLILIVSGVALADGPERVLYEYAAASPFRDLYRHDGISTSNDEHTIWVFLLPARGTVRLSGYEPLDAESRLDLALGDWTIGCRAPLPGAVGSSLEGYAEGRPLQSKLFIRRHPEEPDARTFWGNPFRFLLAGLTGRGSRRIPVRFQAGDLPGEAREFVMPNQDYSFPRPDHSVEVSPAGTVSAAHRLALSSASFPVRLNGGGIDIVLEFHPTEIQRRGLGLMLKHCPAAATG